MSFDASDSRTTIGCENFFFSIDFFYGETIFIIKTMLITIVSIKN